eukprot:4392509-Pyramimonas_sp.AAC.1
MGGGAVTAPSSSDVAAWLTSGDGASAGPLRDDYLKVVAGLGQRPFDCLRQFQALCQRSGSSRSVSCPARQPQRLPTCPAMKTNMATDCAVCPHRMACHGETKQEASARR